METIDLRLINLHKSHHRQGDDGLDVPLDHGQLRHHLLGVRRRALAFVVDVPVDPSGHRQAGEVLHLKVQLHDLHVARRIPAAHTHTQMKTNTNAARLLGLYSHSKQGWVKMTEVL